jgi:hypothetical protein
MRLDNTLMISKPARLSDGLFSSISSSLTKIDMSIFELNIASNQITSLCFKRTIVHS